MNKLEAALRFHRDNQIPLAHNIFRPHSENYYKLFEYARQMKESALAPLNEFDEYLLSTDIGKFGMYEGKEVPLDHPFIDEADYKGDDVELNKPKRGGKKKFYVYVKNEKGNVIKFNLGMILDYLLKSMIQKLGNHSQQDTTARQRKIKQRQDIGRAIFQDMHLNLA